MIKINVLAAAAVFFTAGLNAAGNAGSPVFPSAGPMALEKVEIEAPDSTMRNTLGPAALLVNKVSGNLASLEHLRDPAPKTSLVSMNWTSAVRGTISYTFHTTALDALAVKQSKKPGTLFYTTRVKSDGQAFGSPPCAIVSFPGNRAYYKEAMAYNKEFLPIVEPYMDIDEIVRTLQNKLTIDLRPDLRRKLCSCGDVRFKLVPNLSLYNRPGSPFGYTCDLSLAASYKRLSGAGGCVKRGCREGASVILSIDPVTGEYLVSDYWDGLAYLQYAAGIKPVPGGKDAGAKAAGRLKRAFLMFDSLFSSAARPRVRSRDTLEDNTEAGAKGAFSSNLLKVEEDDFKRLDRKIAAERLSSVKEAVRLRPQSAMAHAALGLLLSQDCEREEPSERENCEKGIRSLLRARELAPGLAFPAYVLVKRGGSLFFPKKLRPLLKETPAELCDRFKDSAPAWDWAFYSTCGFKGEKPGGWERSEEYIRKLQDIPVIRPADILLGYLELELSGKQ